MEAGSIREERRTDRIAPTAPSHHSAGSCSVHSGRGASKPYSAEPMPATAPASSTRTAFVAVVETSMPRTWLIGRRPAIARSTVAIDLPDPAVDEPLEQLLAPRHRRRIDRAGRDPPLELLHRDRAAQDALAQLAVPAGVARLAVRLERAPLEHV